MSEGFKRLVPKRLSMQFGTRRRGWVLVLGLVLAGLGGVAQGSIPEDPNPNNLQQWAARYNGPANSGDQARSIAVSPTGSTVFVTGASDGSGSASDYATLAYSAPSGANLWAARYNGPGNSFDNASSLVVSPDGSKVFVTGESVGSSGSSDYATVAYSAATGTELWAVRYDGPSNANDYDAAFSLAVSADGSKVFVTGGSVGSDDSYDYATVAYSATNGAELWAARYNVNSYDFATSLAVSPDGSKVFVTGHSVSSGGPFDNDYDYATVAYSTATGAEVWAARYNGPSNADDYDFAFALVVSPDGSKVFVTGYSDRSGNSYDYATVAYSAETGAQLWVARYSGTGNSGSYASSLAVSPDGSKVFVTGTSNSSGGSSDYATVSYSATTGAELWAARYNGPENASDNATSLAVSPDGSKVFVTGTSNGSGSSSDYATIAYSAETGAQFWAVRYSAPGNSFDNASSLAVSPDGSKVFVTGYSSGSNGYADYATVAYRATTCANGRDEAGPASGVVHNTVEPQTGPGAPYVHGVNCDVVAENGL